MSETMDRCYWDLMVIEGSAHPAPSALIFCRFAQSKFSVGVKMRLLCLALAELAMRLEREELPCALSLLPVPTNDPDSEIWHVCVTPEKSIGLEKLVPQLISFSQHLNEAPLHYSNDLSEVAEGDHSPINPHDLN